MKKQGDRDNKGKPKLSYLTDFPNALREIAKVCEYGGEQKPRGNGVFGYGKQNWKQGLKLTEALDSEERHKLKFYGDGHTYDAEALKQGFRLYHLAMKAWNSLAALEMFLTRPDMDDRADIVKNAVQEGAESLPVNPSPDISEGRTTRGWEK